MEDQFDRPGLAAELAESLQRYRAILDTAVDGIITIGVDGIVESFNRAAEQIFGYASSEIIGRNVKLLMDEPDRGQHDQYISNYVETRKARVIGIGREVVGRRKNGQTFPMDLAIGEVHLPGRLLFTGIVRDISDRRHAEAESRRRRDEIAHLSRLASMGEMASVLAHEVNQPLTAIVSHASACLRMLNRGQMSPELLQDSLRQIARQGERAGEVIRRVRSFVQKTELNRAPCSINELVNDVIWLLGHDIQAMKVRRELVLAPDLPQVQVDRVQIEQILFNLVRNALDAMTSTDIAARRLRIETAIDAADGHDAAAMVRIDVTDSGSGLAGVDISALFQPYFTTKSAGLGQGLAICKSIADAHGGSIQAAQAPSGAGACFTLKLPIEVAA